MRFLEDIPVNNKQKAAWLAEKKTAEEKIIAQKTFFFNISYVSKLPKTHKGFFFFFNINFLDSELERRDKKE